MAATLNTAFLLAAQYDGRAVIPLDMMRKDFFSHLTMDQLLRKLRSGDIPLPVVRIEASQKSPKVVHLNDLANYLDGRATEARKDSGRSSGDAVSKFVVVGYQPSANKRRSWCCMPPARGIDEARKPVEIVRSGGERLKRYGGTLQSNTPPASLGMSEGQ